MHAFFVSAIIKDHVKATRHSDNKLVERLVCVPTTLGPARNVVEIVNSLYSKRNMSLTLDKGEIATRIAYFW